ncbi:hypothetical protein BACI9J_90031 [Bacillus altitudinis]|nr:hypothetical protein BACI9J_90031 [Bacillus altitudinis]
MKDKIIIPSNINTEMNENSSIMRPT